MNLREHKAAIIVILVVYLLLIGGALGMRIQSNIASRPISQEEQLNLYLESKRCR